MKVPEISVIVPVYNAERWLRQCVDSILAQTFTDFELLLIDDGSTDGSDNICDVYVTLDRRVRVFHKPNGGVSSARNLGLDHALGRWITFVDADDWLDMGILDNLYRHSDDCDMVLGDFIYGGSNGNQFPHLNEGMYLFDNIVEILKTAPSLLILNTPWGKLYKKSSINRIGLRFLENLKYGEDAVFNYTFMSREVKKMCCVTGQFYHYRVVEHSLSSRISEEHSVSFANAFYDVAIDFESYLNIPHTHFIVSLTGKYIFPYVFGSIQSMTVSQIRTHLHKVNENKCIKILLDKGSGHLGRKGHVCTWLASRNHTLLLWLWSRILKITGTAII